MPGPRPTRAPRVRDPGTSDAVTTGDTGVAWTVILGVVAVAWVGTYAAGGSKTAVPHLFYVPVILAAFRFRARGALAVALLAGLLAGPLTPLEAATGAGQAAANWVTRLVGFVLIGQLTAYLSGHSLASVRHQRTSRRFCAEMAAAVEGGQLRLVYQPVVDLRSGHLAGVEALVRWEHPARGTVPPAEFIAAAEAYGCIQVITRWVLAEACDQLAGWRSAGQADDDFVLAVNVSALDLGDPGVVDHLRVLLARTGVPARSVHLEITETALVADIDAVADHLATLREMGVRLAIDDFGTGESSLGHLHRFRVDLLKIDRVFVERFGDDDRADVIARGVVGIARALALATVAEGIETSGQARQVRSFGCDLGQGFLFGRPVPAADLTAILADPVPFTVATRALLDPTSAPSS
ncbi:EAL domain-containing protein [Euzebya sp.]|uniref:EAL domain-containing protein n=1 Tax=Euzebya sp. TaxID=1971409 RepID=UPI00351760E6